MLWLNCFNFFLFQVQYPNFKNQARSASKKSKIPNVTREKSYSLNVDKGHNSLIKKLLETSCKKCSYTLTRSRSPMVIVSDNKNDIWSCNIFVFPGRMAFSPSCLMDASFRCDCGQKFIFNFHYFLNMKYFPK